jgi:uncharacterized protein YraI
MKIRPWLIVFSIMFLMSGAIMVTGAEAQTGGCATTHVIQRGENLYRIALRYRTTIADLQARNGISNPNRIFAGQTLCISGGFVPPVTPPPNNTWENMGTVTAYFLNVRTGPGTQYGILRRAVRGEGLRLVGRTADSRWYQVIDDPASGRFAWVSAGYVQFANSGRLPVAQAANPTYSEYVTLIADATVYSGPNATQVIQPGQIFAGMTVIVIGRNADATWFQIRTDEGAGWLRLDVFPNAFARYELPITG